jgi:hypothetical protein
MADELQKTLNRLAGTSNLDAQGAANVWAGTTGMDLVGALNTKAGVWGMEFNGVCQLLGSQLSNNNQLDGQGALGSIGAGYLDLTGAASNALQSANPAITFTPTGSFEWVAYIALDDWTPATNADCVFDSNNGRCHMRIEVTTGRIICSFIGAAGTSTYTSSAAPTVSDGAGLWVKAATASITGNSMIFSTSTNARGTPFDSVSYTQVGTPISAGTVPTTITGCTNLFWGSNSLGGAPADGKFYKGRIKNNGVTIVSVDVTDSAQFVAGATTGRDATGNNWAIVSPATLAAA